LSHIFRSAKELLVTTCAPVPADPGWLVLVLDRDPDRLDAIASAVRAVVPGARIALLDAVGRALPAGTLEEGDGPPPDLDLVLVLVEPGGWATASVLAAHQSPRLGRPVDGFLIAEGPLERFSVLITDFPGLRLLPPGDEVAGVLAGVVLGYRTG
jgi:hypothetical protein